MVPCSPGSAFGLLASGPGPGGPEPVGSEGNWVSLFDGKTLGGWTTADGTPGTWKVEDGVIHGSGPVSHLFSPRGDYKNFKYRAEVKIADKANSGMYFRTKKGPGFPNGYEAQVNSTHTDPVKTGSLYNHVKVFEKLVPPDTWFTQEIEAVGNHIIIKVNGKTTVDYVDKKNTFTQGHFAFQQHDPGSQVWIRKIEVMELPDSPREVTGRDAAPTWPDTDEESSHEATMDGGRLARPRMAGPGDRRRGREAGLGGRVGLALRRQVDRRLDGRPPARQEDEVGGQGRRDRGLGRAVDALQPPGRLQELQVPGRGEDQRQGELRDVRPGPQGAPPSPRATRSRSTAPTRDPIKTGSLYTLVHLYKAAVPPDTWFTQEIEVADVNYRGKMVTKFRISVNGELLYEYLDHDRLWKAGHFAFQQHDPGSKVSIRKVEVMELPPTKEPEPRSQAQGRRRPAEPKSPSGPGRPLIEGPPARRAAFAGHRRVAPDVRSPARKRTCPPGWHLSARGRRSIAE